MTKCRFWTKRDLKLDERKGRIRYVKLHLLFSWHVLGIIGLDMSLGDDSTPRNPSLNSALFHSIELN